MKNIVIKKNQLSAEEYQFFRQAVGWSYIEKSVVEKSLNNELFSVCIYQNHKITAMGRVVGDGAIYFYIQDIMVLPQYHNMGFGNLIMKEIEQYLTLNTSSNSFIGLIAANGVKGFYEKFGYKAREVNAPGMFKTIK
ncbi:hypothetical protein ATO12_08135 [Aquimarina atlantica]|uniref:N-acetyltransferase domain-containing protein n=1 Tax=Aquimarina atlantica TaxID=1317122 RepID=A0A023BNR7_9FLAO|nr:GNAT family N-acetyltransferase [Aquimarina atlantica]EZH71348.1 hypothetical protein ATO12_08135 [Aquimarina atlantica]